MRIQQARIDPGQCGLQAVGQEWSDIVSDSKRMAHILVLAPSEELRKSLQFALEAEGHKVTSRDGFHDPSGLPEDADCAVLDHHAAQGHMSFAADFVERYAPVILLANTSTHPLSPHSFRTVTKPFLGPFLSQAIGSAVRGKRLAT